MIVIDVIVNQLYPIKPRRLEINHKPRRHVDKYFAVHVHVFVQAGDKP